MKERKRRNVQVDIQNATFMSQKKGTFSSIVSSDAVEKYSCELRFSCKSDRIAKCQASGGKKEARVTHLMK